MMYPVEFFFFSPSGSLSKQSAGTFIPPRTIARVAEGCMQPQQLALQRGEGVEELASLAKAVYMLSMLLKETVRQ